MKALRELTQKWNDGTIPVKAKGEVVAKFNTRFERTNKNRFYLIISDKHLPTPDEFAVLKELIDFYWSFYNEDSPVTP